MTVLARSIVMALGGLALATPALAIGAKASSDLKTSDGKEAGTIKMVETTKKLKCQLLICIEQLPFMLCLKE